MIIKTISCKSKLAVRNALKYILAAHKVEQKMKPGRIPYIPGVKLTERDVQNLNSEKVDSTIMSLLREYKGTVEEFIKNELMAKDGAFQPDINGPLVLTHNVRLGSKDMLPKEIAKAYEENEKYRINTRANQNYATHSIISFHAKDTSHLDNSALKGIMDKYVSLRNSNAMYTFAVHRDRSFVHIHAVESSIEYMTGKNTRISKDRFREIKQELQQFQEKEFPNVKYSSVRHDKAKEFDKGTKNLYKNADRTYLRDQINASVTSIVEKSTSTSDFIAKVYEAGYEVYSRSGRITGVQCPDNGFKMRFSRMGLKEKIQELDVKNERIETALKEMKNLREHGKRINRDKQEVEKESDQKPADSFQQNLNELQALRQERNDEGREQISEGYSTEASDETKDNEDDDQEQDSSSDDDNDDNGASYIIEDDEEDD